jgi:hypothetical protein
MNRSNDESRNIFLMGFCYIFPAKLYPVALKDGDKFLPWNTLSPFCPVQLAVRTFFSVELLELTTSVINFDVL